MENKADYVEIFLRLRLYSIASSLKDLRIRTD